MWKYKVGDVITDRIGLTEEDRGYKILIKDAVETSAPYYVVGYYGDEPSGVSKIDRFVLERNTKLDVISIRDNKFEELGI